MLPEDVIDNDDKDVAPIKFLPGVDDHIARSVWSVAHVVGVLVENWRVEGVEDVE